MLSSLNLFQNRRGWLHVDLNFNKTDMPWVANGQKCLFRGKKQLTRDIQTQGRLCFLFAINKVIINLYEILNNNVVRSALKKKSIFVAVFWILRLLPRLKRELSRNTLLANGSELCTFLENFSLICPSTYTMVLTVLILRSQISPS